MPYVLSYIRPDRTAVVCESTPDLVGVGHAAFRVLIGEARRFMTWGACDLFQDELIAAFIRHPGTELVTPSGYTFRIDPADNPPNVCPCCSGLVRPGDHAHAGQEDAYCLGCFTWDRNTPQCLPENTAHPVGYDPDKEG